MDGDKPRQWQNYKGKRDVKIISISAAIDSHVHSLATWSLHVPPVAVWVVFGTLASSHSTKTRTVS